MSWLKGVDESQKKYEQEIKDKKDFLESECRKHDRMVRKLLAEVADHSYRKLGFFKKAFFRRPLLLSSLMRDAAAPRS